MVQRVCVVGAGVVGVGSAISIQRRLASVGGPVEVAILAETITPNTTGDNAAGVWGPRYIDGEHQQINSWGQRTHDFLHQLWLEGNCPGIGLLTACDIGKKMPQPYWSVVPFSCTPLSRQTLQRRGHSDDVEAVQYVTFYTEPKHLLPFLLDEFRSGGGRLEVGRVACLDDLADYDVIVNCSGLGARQLAADERVEPVRGQVLRVSAPQQKTAQFNLAAGAYVIPNDTWLIAGGTAQRGDWRTVANPDDTASILQRCSHLVPSLEPQLRAYRDDAVWAGLRPFRSGGVRLETEHRRLQLKCGDGGAVTRPVVHNYGHGGAGVTLFWGCGQDAADIVIRLLQTTNSIGSKL